MSEAPMLRKVVPQTHSSTSASGQTQMTTRQPYITEPIASKHVCFYKSGDAQFSGLPMVVNSRTFKTFEALLDSLSKRVPLPFGVRNITTPSGHTAVRSLEQLHHGHSYICSDRRTVKPVDLERARRKLPPWYHARPVTAHRTAWQTHTPAPRGTRSAKGNKHVALLDMPKRLVVFRNGDTEVKHTLMLQKRATSSFEALLQHMSEVMIFPVLRLYTPDGRRVDGLPALILCSGVLVATGREDFKTGNYDIQKTSPQTWLPAKRVGRLHLIERKMKSSSTKSRPFSPSSERYVVEQIHNSIVGSTCDVPSNPVGSLEIESGQLLESVAETHMISCLDGEGDIHALPEDDIEKSFRVNQDGSMTVEMKVRLTIKEEETVHWTTTVSRSSVTNQITAFSDSSLDLDAGMPPLIDPMIAEVSDPIDNNHLKNSEANEQRGINRDAVVREIQHPPSPQTESPGLHKVQQSQASAESIRTITDTEIEENSSYSYKEQLDSGEMMEKHCTVHCSRPVPKPRGTLASEINTTTTTRVQSSSYRASDVLQLQENGMEVCETVLHIYENQRCKENFSGNVQLGLQRFGTSPHGLPHGHLAAANTVSQAASDTTFRSSSADIEPETVATYKHKKQLGKQLPSTHKTNASSYRANTASTKKVKEPVAHFTPARASQKTTIAKRISTSSTTSKRKPVRVIVKKKYLLKTYPERKQKDIKADILKEIRKIRADLLSQTGALKFKEPIKAKAVQKLLKQRNSPECILLKSKREQLESNDSLKAEDASISYFQESSTQALTKKNLLHSSQPGTQTCNQEISQCMSLPAVHSSSSLKNEYVELWLQKSQPPHLYEEPLPTTKTQKSTFHNEQKFSTEDPKIVDEVKGGDRVPQDSISNLDSVMKTTVSTNHSTKNATSSSSLNGHSPRNTSLPACQKMTQLKESPNIFDVRIENNLSIIQKNTPSPSLQSTPLPNQPSLETIPKNNTKDKASLFHNQSVEKTELSTKEHFEKDGAILEPSQTKKRPQEKAQENSAYTTKTTKNLISEINSKNFSCDAESCTPHERGDLRAEKFNSVKMAVSPDMKPVLDNLCHSHSKKSSSLSNCVLEDYVNLNVNSAIDRAVSAPQPESSTSQISMTESLSRPDTETFDKREKDLKGENFSDVKIIEKYNSIPDSDFCEDMPSIESSFGMELQKKQVQELKVRHKRQKVKTMKKHQKNEKEMRVERQRGSDEGRGTLEENNSGAENYTYLEDGIRKGMIDKETDQHTDANEDSESLVSCEGNPTFYKGETFNEREYENCDQELGCFPEGTSFDEEENITVKCPMFYDDTEQTCSEDEISGHWQSQSKSPTFQTAQKVPTRTDIGLPEQQGKSHVIDEIEHSNTAQDFYINNSIDSDEEHVIMKTPECYTIYQELPEAVSEYEEKAVDFIDEKKNVVDKLIGSLNAEENRSCKTHQISGKMLLNHINVTNVETPKMTKTTDSTSMDSLSTSLAFSYDTKTSELARDPEANIQINRVKSIREMFLAKSNTDCATRMHTTEHQCSTSLKDEDTCRLAIAKGYVKRTIERLYGKGIKGVASDEDKPPSTQKTKKRKGPKGTNVTSLASIHEARTNVVSDVSYFSATSFIGGFTDPNVTLKTWVGHKDAVLIDKGRWLLRENQTSPNSSTQAEDPSKSVELKEKAVLESEQNSGKEDAPYSLFGPTTPDKVPPFKEQEEYAGSTGTTFTYIHLPNARDSEIEADNTERAKRDTENTVTPLIKPDKVWTEKHGIFTVFSLPDIKKPNKVQPTVEATPPIVTQPSKGQSVHTKVAKRSSEPDALEILYIFCGQHCPLL
ncbi:Oxygen-regulated protein 1 [Triplophysa tibetana]|uniref:Oxygen-regulated protein 1 n=1 Tax=Triplophysa tibetana TaxID=1572043 RepID=A0A5A9PS63_9TELE|nr:Oxygen-regulated protein 1 [Triplophysa tibetana]